MLRMQDISKIYRTDLIETHALRDFSLQVRQGEFVAVSGPSGSGKTTFAKLLVRLLRPTEGEISIAGVPLDEVAAVECGVGEGARHDGHASACDCHRKDGTEIGHGDRRRLGETRVERLAQIPRQVVVCASRPDER